MEMNGLINVEKEITAKPELLLYTSKHTWAGITPDGNIRVGVTEYAQKQLKGIAHILTEPLGKEIKQMEAFGIAETWMFVFDLYAPVGGKIVKVNTKLDEEPYIINEDPYGKGWIVEIKPETAVLEQQLKKLLSAAQYSKLIGK
jgi:glycine cleavage system H protein